MNKKQPRTNMRSKVKSPGQIESENVFDAVGIDIPADPSKRNTLHAKLAQTWGSGKLQWEVDCGRCKVCNKPIPVSRFDLTPHGYSGSMSEGSCWDCYIKYRSCYYGEGSPVIEVASETPNWDATCPPRFSEALALPELPPGVDREAFRAALEWRPSRPKAPALQGPAGTGKTLALYAVAREAEAAGLSVSVFNAVAIHNQLIKAARDQEEAHALKSTDLVCVDDFGKEKLTPAASAQLWDFLDYRYAHKKHLIISTQFIGPEIAARFDTDPKLGSAIARRLNELCYSIRFSLPIAHAA